MKVMLLLVAEVELPENGSETRDAALKRVQTLVEVTDDITFYTPAIGWVTESRGTKSVQVFY
jgi:hypothetical protein